MGEIVNLRRARKAKRRVEAESEAAANRARFGRARDERAATEANEAQRLARLDAHRRDAPDRGAAGDDER
jgi:hypothetical protein